jgi:formylglycine-generating enzyme required for sulfatase activity
VTQLSQLARSISLASVAYVKAGKYSIGSNNIPNASPQHFRELRPYWIDRMPVTFGHFERFVASGGYDDNSLWFDSVESQSIASIDQRCEQLLEQSIVAAGLFRNKPTHSVDIPLVGVSWSEAAAIARFAGGRLAFESEWEVAMQRSANVSKRQYDSAGSLGIATCWQHSPRSDWGCVVATNVLQEWTADAFSPVYWRADSDRHGVAWTPGQVYGVSLRGSCKADMHKDHRFRRGADPMEIHSARSFRRVWECEPSPVLISSDFALH